jgi:hypothetical protein
VGWRAAFGSRIVRWATPTWTVRIGLLAETGFHLVLGRLVVARIMSASTWHVFTRATVSVGYTEHPAPALLPDK